MSTNDPTNVTPPWATRPPTTPATPATPSTPDPRDAEIEQLQAQLDEARAELASATATTGAGSPAAPALVPVAEPGPPSGTTATQSRVAALTASTAAPSGVEQPAGGQEQATHAIAPGSAGEEVHKLAQTLEAAGERTYLSDPNTTNSSHVFTDELLNAVRRAVSRHPEAAALAGAEADDFRRWVNRLEIVSADVWTLLEEVAAEKTKEPASA